MKTILLMLTSILLLNVSSTAQINGYKAGSGNTQQYEHPLNANGQVPQAPNYYQNNSNFNNNSTQTNKPSTDPTKFPGNGNYVDPTRHDMNGTLNNGVNTNNVNPNGTLNNGTPGQIQNGVINTGNPPAPNK